MSDETESNAVPPAEDVETNTPPPEGWVQVPVRRGLFEIEPLLKTCELIGGRIIGGYARFCCSPREHPQPPGDVDIFPVGNTEEESQVCFSMWKAMLENKGLTIKHENNVSITWSADEKAAPFDRCPSIQLIKPIREGAIVTWGTVEQILDNFDFTVVRCALNMDRATATAWASFLDDEQHRRLRILNIHCPISSLLRVMKYARKGYYMRPVEALKLFADWERRTPEYRQRMYELFNTGEMGKLSKQEIDELEALLRVD